MLHGTKSLSLNSIALKFYTEYILSIFVPSAFIVVSIGNKQTEFLLWIITLLFGNFPVKPFGDIQIKAELLGFKQIMLKVKGFH